MPLVSSCAAKRPHPQPLAQGRLCSSSDELGKDSVQERRSPGGLSAGALWICFEREGFSLSVCNSAIPDWRGGVHLPGI